MPEKPNRKNQPELSSSVTPLLIVGNDRLAPYIQVFSHQPENIVQHSLGCLFGIFKIDDTSVDSAFIVNFLVSEIKKEYYGNPRRTPAGSFEAGLNRINIALSELAKQGNISWIGKLESAVCALEKNGMLHFSVTGPSHIALLREGSLSLISEGLASESDTPNPLKTFTEISSGKLHPQDLVVLGSRELFNFLPREKMERSARHFSYEEFTRFLHTALVNEFDFCAAVTVLLNKKLAPKATKKSAPTVSPESIPNLWGSGSFRERERSATSPAKTTEEIQEGPSKEPAASSPESPRDGHLYIQQQPSDADISRQEFKESFLILREHLANMADEHWEAFRTTTRQWRRSFAKKIQTLRDEAEKKAQEKERQKAADSEVTLSSSDEPVPQPVEENPQETLPPEDVPARSPQKTKKKIVHEIHPQEKTEEVKNEKKNPLPEKNIPPKHLPAPAPKSLAEKLRESALRLSEANASLQKESISSVQKRSIPVHAEHATSSLRTALARTRDFVAHLELAEKFQALRNAALPMARKTTSLAARLSSSFLKTTHAAMRRLLFRFQSLSLKQRLVVLVVLLCVAILPFVFGFSKKQTIEIPPTTNETAANESASAPIETPEASTQGATVYASQNTILKTFPLEGNLLLVVEKGAVILIPEKEALQTYPLPSENGTGLDAAYMNDLSLLFILTNKGTIVSFSPVSKKFSANNLTLEKASSEKTFIGSYLTYLYVADVEQNTILRYPRAEGGFGAPTTWLAPDSGVSLAGSENMIVNESVYLAKSNGILRLSNKKANPWPLDTSSSTLGFVSVSEDAKTIVATDTKDNAALLFDAAGTLKKNIPFGTSSSPIIGASVTNGGSVYAHTDREVRLLGQ